MVLSEQTSHLTGVVGSESVITQVDDQLDRLVISVSAPAAGWLVVADVQSGWHAKVNGVSQALVAADHALVAVPIPEGASTVTLEYRPPGLQAGIRISTMSVALVVLLAYGLDVEGERLKHLSLVLLRCCCKYRVIVHIANSAKDPFGYGWFSKSAATPA